MQFSPAVFKTSKLSGRSSGDRVSHGRSVRRSKEGDRYSWRMEWLFFNQALKNCHHHRFSFSFHPKVAQFFSLLSLVSIFFLNVLHSWIEWFADLVAVLITFGDACFKHLYLRQVCSLIFFSKMINFFKFVFRYLFVFMQGFPSSVTADYVPFQIWDSLQVTITSSYVYK